jgi:pimeloyl-ACP methyl ester carboxylesterase
VGSKTKQVLVIALASGWLFAIISSSFTFAIAQPSDSRLPLVLIHGYAQDRSVWNTWIQWLANDNFVEIHPITFQHDDKCGSVQQHAVELSGIVDRILEGTDHERVNIVGYSKGGLDARGYLATDTDKVANLIMIGTPNDGSTAAYWDTTDCPFGASDELLPGSPATQVQDHPENTNYFAIAGNWNPDIWCPSVFGIWYPDGGNCFIYGEDDKLVTVKSVFSSPEYTPLGEFPHDHFNLLTQQDVYQTAVTRLDR